MGLDMYLTKKRDEEVGYWRKANQIHRWFVSNVQGGKDDCGEYAVPRAKLMELKVICETVLNASKLVKGEIANGKTLNKSTGVWEPIMEAGEYIEDPTVAKNLLPVFEGYFFGSYDYNQYYLEDIKETLKILEPLLKDDDEGNVYYSSSW